jgi:hypothetical protein
MLHVNNRERRNIMRTIITEKNTDKNVYKEGKI